MQHKNWR